MTPAEAKAWLDGFAAGAIFFASSFAQHAARPEAYDRIRAELREAHRRAREVESEQNSSGTQGRAR